MSDRYSIDRETPELDELSQKSKKLAEERKEYKERYWTEMSPREAEEYFKDVNDSVIALLFKEIIDSSKLGDKSITNPENIVFQEGIGEELQQAIQDQFDASDLNEGDASTNEERTELFWKLLLPLFNYAERNLTWPHAVGAKLERLARGDSKYVLNRIDPGLLLTLVEDQAATDHTYRVISLLVQDTPSIFYDVSNEFAVALAQQRESGDEPGVGLLSLIEIFNTFAEHYPDTVINDHSEILRRLIRIAGDESVQHTSRKVALKSIRSLASATSSVDTLVAEESAALQSIITERELELVTIACDVIVQADVKDEHLREPLQELKRVLDLDLLLAVQRALATLDGNQQSALEALALKTDESKKELLQQLGHPDPLLRAHAAAALDLSSEEADIREVIRQIDDPDPLVFECLCRTLEDISFDHYGRDIIKNLIERLLTRTIDENANEREQIFLLELLYTVYVARPSITFEQIQASQNSDIFSLLDLSERSEAAPILVQFGALHLDFWHNEADSHPEDIEVDRLTSKFVDLVQSVKPAASPRGHLFSVLDNLWLQKRLSTENLEEFFEPAVKSAELDLSGNVNKPDGASEVWTKAQGIKLVGDIACATSNYTLLPTVYEGFAEIGTEYKSLAQRAEDPVSGDVEFDPSLNDGVVDAIRAIHLIAGFEFDVPSETREALLWLIDHSDDRVAQWAVKALGNAGGESAIDKLSEISKSPDYSTTIRREAGEILNNTD